MSNSKISALTSATTPLAGTEVLPVVQGSATTKVTVANLTAGRAVSASSITLTTALAATSGGTGSTSAFVANAIPYASSTTALSTSANWTYDGTNAILLNGRFGIGSSTVGGLSGALHIASPVTGATSSRVVLLDSQIQSDVTVSGSYIAAASGTAAAAFTLTEINYFDALQGTFGAGSAVTNQYGFRVRPTLVGATKNYGFRGQIPAAANRYNIYMDGTASNYLAGGLNVGATADPGAGNISLTGNVVIGTSGKGVTTDGAIPLGLGTNGSTTQAILDTSGNLGIGVTPRKQLSVGSYLDLYSGAAATPTVPSIRASAGNNLILNAYSTGITYLNFDSGSGGVIIANGANGSLVTVASTGNTTLNTGNIIQGTAAKGFDFSANTPLAGKTSTLLNWYEEGTWTPNQGAGLTLVGAFSSTGKYTRVGRNVTISGTVTGATSVAVTAAGVVTTNLPFTIGTAGHGNATNAAITAFAAVICNTGTTLTSAGAIAATGTITFSATYFV